MDTSKTLSIKWVSKIQGINILWSVGEVRDNVFWFWKTEYMYCYRKDKL